MNLLAITFGMQDLTIGLVIGLTYAALAAGFVLIYRSTGVLNFAHAEIGALSLAIFVLLLIQYDLNWWLAYGLSVVFGATIAGLVELVIVRRLFDAPRLVLLIATIGVAQLVQAVKINLPAVRAAGPIRLPFTTVFEPTDSLRLLPRDYIVLIVVPALILALSVFLSKTRFGLAVRATEHHLERRLRSVGVLDGS